MAQFTVPIYLDIDERDLEAATAKAHEAAKLLEATFGEGSVFIGDEYEIDFDDDTRDFVGDEGYCKHFLVGPCLVCDVTTDEHL